MTEARSHPAYGRKRKEKWRRGTNVGKRCLSRSESVEGPEAVKPAERLLQSEPGEFFFPGPRSHFSAFGHQPGAFFWLPFSFAGKEKGDSGRTGRAFLLVRMILPAVFFGYKPRVYPGFRVENRVSPHSDAGSRKKNLTSKLAGILWIPRRSAG